MKRIVVTLNWPLLRNRWRRILITGRAYFILSLGSMLVFVMLGLAGMLQNAVAASPVQSMKGFAASLSGGFFGSLLGMELPHMKTAKEDSPLKSDVVASFLIRFLTNLNPDDPKACCPPRCRECFRTSLCCSEPAPEERRSPLRITVRSNRRSEAERMTMGRRLRPKSQTRHCRRMDNRTAVRNFRAIASCRQRTRSGVHGRTQGCVHLSFS
ncbi:hypothetical protein [Cohnella faecalis]|uniref:Uncharacterized protein n=1 Tax=Cohnella faecalis TaxID=2315694 RepID=A0A398CNI9_9BACL|nr:hypothetical protein [Cohnella faecalis]RIE04173.1 hypothetical protein D3H35_05985 [Cohnella faecalis]